MWKFTVVAVAKPVMVLVAFKTCFKSNEAMELAATETAGSSTVPFKAMVTFAAAPAVLVTMMFVTTADVAAGVVYRVALDVAAAVLDRTFVVVAISYYTFP
jgi:hypothetical protein